jgi:histidinol-phosphate aminotransferase
MTMELEKLTLVEKVWPSEANFLLIRVRDAELTYNYLVNNKIIVRNRSNVVGNSLRITIGTKKENDALLKTLKEMQI